MPKNNIRVWELSSLSGAVELDIAATSSLDTITRQLPQGLYSTFRTFDGGRRVLGLQFHLQRLYQPADREGINPAVQANTLRKYLSDVLKEYPSDVRVRTILTMEGKIYIALTPLIQLSPEVYQRGVKVITANVKRESPRVKSTAFISASQNTRKQIADSEVFEALLVRRDIILEGMTSNFFYVRDRELGTARQNVLLGVTRRVVLRVARGSDISVRYRALKRDQISALSEAFLTSSSRGVVPIVQIDEQIVGEGMPGEITKKLSHSYDDYVLRYTEPIY